MTIQKCLPGKLFAAAALCMLCAGSSAADQLEQENQSFKKLALKRDIQLAKKLNENGLTDYADAHINRLLKENPNEDLLKAQLIDNLVAQNKMDEAREMLSRLQEGSEAYFNAIANLGVYVGTRRDFNACIEFIEPVLDYAIKTDKISDFKTPFIFLMAAYRETGRAEDAQKVIQILQAEDANSRKAKKGAGKESAMQKHRHELYMRANFAIEGADALQKKITERGPVLDAKFKEAFENVNKQNEAEVKRQLADTERTFEAKIASFDDTKKAQYEQFLKQDGAAGQTKQKALDTKYIQLLQKAINAKKEELPALNRELRETVKARTDFYKKMAEYLDLSETEIMDYAKLVEDEAMLAFRKTKLNELKKQRDDADKRYYDALSKNKDYDEPGKQRMECYLRLGRLIGMTDAESAEMANMAAVRWRQPGRRNLVIKGYQNLNDNERKAMEQKLPMDWLDVLYQCIADCEEVQWGGLDVLTAKAVVLNMRANAMLRDQKTFEHALTLQRKYRDLFRLCDEAYAKDGEAGLEQSPGSDARIWEGIIHAWYGDFLFKANKKPEALKEYKKAFVSIGKLLKDVPKHKDAVTGYSTFTQVAQKISDMDQKLAASIRKQVRKVPKPEGQAAQGENEKLVTPLAESEYRQGMQLAAELQKRERSKKPPTAAEWQKCIEHFKKVADELDGKMAGKRNSPNMPELLNRLLVAYGYTGDLFMVKTLGDYGLFKFKGDPLVSHGVLVAANAVWDKASKLEKNEQNAKSVAEGRALKAQAVELYDLFLAIDKAHKNAPQVVVRIARDEFIRANETGLALNKAKTPDERVELRKEWIAGFDRAIARYDFVLNNYRNRPELVDEAFERSAEAYTLTERLEKAIEVNKRFCENGSDKPEKIITAKMDIAVALYNIGGNLEKQARAKQEKAAAIMLKEPVKPELNLEPPAPVAAPAAPAVPAPAAPAAPAAAKPGAAPAAATAAAAPAKPAVRTETPEEKEKREAQAKADFEVRMKKYEAALKELEVDKARKAELTAEAEKLTEQAKTVYFDSISHINELMNKWLAKGGRYEQLAGDISIAANMKRAAAILPWLYDSCGDKENAIKLFNAYIKRYPQDKAVSQYLFRLSVIYSEINKMDEAGKILDKLSTEYADTPEGKKAKFAFVKNHYERGNYEVALQNLKDVFDKPEVKKNLSITNYRWIASEFAACPSDRYKAVAAQYAILASEELLKEIRTVEGANATGDVKGWVGELKAIEFDNDPQARMDYFSMLHGKLLIDAAKSAGLTKNYPLAVKYYTDLEKMDKENKRKGGKQYPYFYQLYFGRIDAYLKMQPQNLEGAKKDLVTVGRRANLAGQPLLYNKSQVMLGEIWEQQKDLKKAYAFYTMVAGLPYNENTPLAVDPKNPEDDVALYLEKAVYKAAETAYLLASAPNASAETKQEMQDSMKAMIEKYEKYYPDGKYRTEIRKLKMKAL